MKTVESDKLILLFDGECNLCNNAVKFVIKHDKNEKFRFASLQSETGKNLAEKHYIQTQTLETFVLIRGQAAFVRSNAALELFSELDGAWKILYVFKIIPTFIRDIIYNVISGNRYRLFGKTACMVPTPELKSRFIE